MNRNAFLPHVHKQIRGGRLRKASRGIISFAPFFAGVLTIALGAVLAASLPVEAGVCDGGAIADVRPWTCSGVANSSADGTLTIEATANQGLNITDDSTFGLDVSSGKGIVVMTDSTSTSITLDLRGNISAQNEAIEIDQDGTGAVAITTGGTITSTAADGILVKTASGTTGDVEITTSGTVMAQENGIEVSHNGTGDLIITASGAITSTARRGIFATTASTTGDARITANGSITTNGSTTSETDGVFLKHQGGGSSTFTTGDDFGIQASRDAVYLSSADTTTTMEVDIGGSGEIRGSRLGFYAYHRGTSYADIDIRQNVIGGEHGVYIETGTETTALTLKTADVDATANMTDNDADGIFITHRGSGDFILESRDVQGNDLGIRVNHMGSGTITITSAGTVRSGLLNTATGAHGIVVGASGDVTTTTVTAMGNIDTNNRGDGIRVRHAGTSGDTIVTAHGTIAGTHGINIEKTNTTNGNIEITSNGSITAQQDGIEVDHKGTGALTITAGDAITSTAERGIFAKTASATTGDVRITANGNIMAGKEAIYLQHNGSGDAHITTSGAISQIGEEGIVVVADEAQTGDININVIGDITTTDMVSGTAIFVNNGSGTTRVNVFESTITSSTGRAVEVLGAADAIVTLNDGANLNANFDADSVSFTGTATLALAGMDTSGDNSFQLDRVSSVDNLEKNGTGTWTLTGGQAADDSFINFNVNEGRIVWDTASALAATSVSIADRGILAIANNQTWSTNLTLSGVIELTGSGSSLALDMLAGNGGSVDIEVDFSDGDTNLGMPRLSITTVDGGPIIVNVMAVGGFPEISEDDEDEAITVGNLISATTAEDGDFVAGRALNRGFDFDIIYDVANSRWDIVAQAAGGSIEDGLFETLPAALSQLASLESYQQRIQGRAFAGGDNRIYGKVSRSSSDVEPNSTNLATYDINNTSVRFGVELPLRINHPRIADNFTVGANIDFGSANTDVSVEEDAGKISTDSIKAAINATWQSDDGVYLDGQLQYATSKNDIKTDINLGSTDAAAYSLGAEIGWGLELEDFSVTPSAQIAWTEVDVEGFTSASGDVMTIDDGNVLNGRIGVAVEREWHGILPEDVLLRGHADLLAPLEGEVIANIDGVKMLSERKEPSVNIGIGASYAWDGLGISADVSTQQGGETEGYAGTLGFKYEF